MGILDNFKEFLEKKVDVEYSTGKTAKCLKYKCCELFDPIDN